MALLERGPVVVARLNVRLCCLSSVFLETLQPVNHASRMCSFQWLSWVWAGNIASKSWLVEICRRTHMEILRMFVDLAENLCNLLLVFFALQNFLPRRPLRHLTKFEHVIKKYPAQYQNWNVQSSIERTQQIVLSFPLILPRLRSSTPYSQRRGVPQF